MMKRSFAEIDSAQNENNRLTQLEDLKERFISSSKLDCSQCVQNIEEYYEKCYQINELNNEMQVLFPVCKLLLFISPVGTIFFFTTSNEDLATWANSNSLSFPV